MTEGVATPRSRERMCLGTTGRYAVTAVAAAANQPCSVARATFKPLSECGLEAILTYKRLR
jgi:hypothetical protein